MSYSPKTGAKCFCRRGVQRDNCSSCEGTGHQIDFKKIREHTHEFVEGKSGKVAVCVCGKFQHTNLKEDDIIREVQS